MTRPVYWAFAVLVLALAPPVEGNADEGQVRELLVHHANTPEQHAATARYYTRKAQEARQEAVRHIEMGELYAGGEMKDRRMQKEHCERIAFLHLQMADEYEALGQNHRNEARGRPGDADEKAQ